ncbi:hypothetical protein COCMIDRAFT_5214 [Bipolaris oryzae ATCC 44560]|uniref:Uncharacterized protein n=1 Tax=Bipolaris oryzae ATCC 44560 TaxID=930090 RepID=W6ZPP4_COCMI|nr:uncharacterized protein COCMIDRAFT_5214 [Bipolaris oryzae ATCC 44560]EUC45591.1 hypothetical protein COCMIDRAFT_5214 [Bipolaris oryzae ATCC 44560]
MIASALIIYTANNDSVTSWSVPAAVVLAIISSLVNICLGTILSFGVTVSWWRSASRGTTLKSLHLIWERDMGATFWSAIISGYDTRRVAVVAILVAAIKFMNNPLLQNALRTEGKEVVEMIPMYIEIVDQIPDGYLGKRNGMVEPYGISTALGDLGARALRGWYRNQTAFSIPAHISDLEEWEKICPRKTGGTCGGFAYPINSTCRAMGVLESDECLIQAATVDISISLQWSIVKGHGEPRPISVYRSGGDLADAPKDAKAGPLSGIGYAIGGFFRSLSTLEDINAVVSDHIATTFWAPKSHPEGCANEYLRPTEDVIFAMQEFMAHASIYAARVSNGKFHRNVTMEKFTSTTVCKADFRYLGTTLTVIFIGLVTVVILLWDWWSLDRLNVTLSPVETARAFGAPILMSQRQESGDVEAILKRKGHLKVKYDGDVIVATNVGDGADVELSLLEAQNPWYRSV